MQQVTETASQTYDRLVAHSIVGWVESRKAHPEATLEEDDVFPQALRAIMHSLLDELEAAGRPGEVVMTPAVWSYDMDSWPDDAKLGGVVREIIVEVVSQQVGAFIAATEAQLVTA